MKWPSRSTPLPQSFQWKVRSNSTRGVVGAKAQVLFDRALGRFDAGTDDDIAIASVCAMLGLAPFQIGELVLARRLEHAVAGVPVGLQRDLVEKAVRQAAQRWPRLVP